MIESSQFRDFLLMLRANGNLAKFKEDQKTMVYHDIEQAQDADTAYRLALKLQVIESFFVQIDQLAAPQTTTDED